MTDTKLRNDPLWKDIYAVAGHVYGKLDELIANHPNEEWATASKLRNAANDSMFYASQAIAGTMPEASEYEWNAARKNLFSLQAMYLFATKQKFFDIEPSIVVKIDTVLKIIDGKLHESKREAEERTEKDLEPWLEKYRLWREMQAD